MVLWRNTECSQGPSALKEPLLNIKEEKKALHLESNCIFMATTSKFLPLTVRFGKQKRYFYTHKTHSALYHRCVIPKTTQT